MVDLNPTVPTFIFHIQNKHAVKSKSLSGWIKKQEPTLCYL